VSRIGERIHMTRKWVIVPAPCAQAHSLLKERRRSQESAPRKSAWLGRASTGRHPSERQKVLAPDCPQSGQLLRLRVNRVDSEMFQFFLDEVATAVPPVPRERQLLVMDKVSCHKAARLNWYHFGPVYCPAFRRTSTPSNGVLLRSQLTTVRSVPLRVAGVQ
jgi:hypothetical protein